ncbi:MAG TPA: S41 family peptidase [Gemmatimonadaceae bacterium]|nr:S41 family peptidase [Gemmatimonadaceae bacterium]
MSRITRSRKFALASVVALPLVAGGFMLQSRVARGGEALLDQVLQLVNERFVDTLDQGQLYEKAARGLVKELNDPYSELLSPKDFKAFSTNTGGRYGGIGMQIEPQQDQIVISKVFPNTPAEAAGVREGDRIVQIDTIHVIKWTTQQAQDQLMGTPGTKVTVKFARPGVANPIEVHFTRAIIHVPAVRYAISFGPNGDRVGYIPLDRFNETAAQEVQDAVRTLQKQNVRGVVLDFRGNPGGILDQSLAISNLFLKDGQEIASIRARNGETQPYVARGNPSLPTTPLVVLTDEYTASASEIVAGALQDHDRALILGQTSFGKGLVQSVFNLDGGYALKLTTAKWYTPSGRSIQRERKFENGHFVETQPDTTAETESVKKNRPAYKSDAGRLVYGGGGITPDVIVADDTLTSAEQRLAKALAAKQQDFYTTYYDYSLELSKKADKDFKVQPEWRDELLRRLQAKGLTVDRKDWDASARYIDRLLEQRVARFAFGDSAAKRRDLPYDAPLRKAIELLDKGTTQKELFALASSEATRMPTAQAKRQ